MTKAVFFDWDGTLVDSLPMLHGAHNHVRQTFDLPIWDRDEYMKHMLHSTRELYPRIYGDRAQEGIDILYKYITDNHLDHLSLIDGAEDVLLMLKERGVPMGLVSNKRNDVLRREVEHLGWQKYFDVYIGAGVAAMDKPSGAPLIHALGLHPRGLTIDNILYVGDTESDLSCAKEAGCPVIFITHPPRRDDLIARYNPLHVVNNLLELKEKLIEFLDGAAKKAS
jgi:phosphoglycolate phosphatase